MKSHESSADRGSEARVRVAAALEALPEQDRLLLSMRLLEGLTTLESAGALRMTTAEVERRTALALRVLSRQIMADSQQRRAA